MIFLALFQILHETSICLIDKRNLSTSYIRSSEILFELEGNCFILVAGNMKRRGDL
jgi:hypothetical protein